MIFGPWTIQIHIKIWRYTSSFDINRKALITILKNDVDIFPVKKAADICRSSSSAVDPWIKYRIFFKRSPCKNSKNVTQANGFSGKTGAKTNLGGGQPVV